MSAIDRDQFRMDMKTACFDGILGAFSERLPRKLRSEGK